MLGRHRTAQAGQEEQVADFVLLLRWLHSVDKTQAKVGTSFPTMRIHMPATMCFLQGVSMGWYFTSASSGDVRRKKIANLRKADFIHEILTWRKEWGGGGAPHSIAAMFVSSTVGVDALPHHLHLALTSPSLCLSASLSHPPSPICLVSAFPDGPGTHQVLHHGHVTWKVRRRMSEGAGGGGKRVRV